jgi:ribosomal protein S12 methylthiotransferase
MTESSLTRKASSATIKTTADMTTSKPIQLPNAFAIISLGCPKNQADSESLVFFLEKQGFQLSSLQQASIVLLNTCAFIEDAKKESIEEIFNLVNGGKKLIVIGCLPERYSEELKQEIPEVDYFFGVNHQYDVLNALKTMTQGQTTFRSSRRVARQRLNPQHYAYLKIAEGCNRQCTFCIIPKLRGPYRSFPEHEILTEAERLIDDGVKELILVGQETTRYGYDLGQDQSLTKLLGKLSDLKGDFWIRLLYAHPSSLTDALLETIQGHEKIVKYIDVPLQHSEEKILKAMCRQGNEKSYLALIEKIRRIVPGAILRTSLIVGFPQESEHEYNGLLSFVEQAEFDRLGVFQYSQEEGTVAAKMKRQIPASTKQERMERLMNLQAEISLKKNRQFIGRRLTVIVDEEEQDKQRRVLIGRTEGQTPEVDGVTVIYTAAQNVTIGEFVKIQVTDASDYDLEGVLIGEYAK